MSDRESDILETRSAIGDLSFDRDPPLGSPKYVPTSPEGPPPPEDDDSEVQQISMRTESAPENQQLGVERTSTRNDQSASKTAASGSSTSKSSAPRSNRTRAERNRDVIFKILIADFSKKESPEDAEESAKEMLDHYCGLKDRHERAMDELKLEEGKAHYRLGQAQLAISDCESLIKDAHGEKNSPASLRNARTFLNIAKGHLEDWPSIKKAMMDKADETKAVFYRPDLKLEPGAKKLMDVVDTHTLINARIKTAEEDLSLLLAPSTPAPVSTSTSGSISVEKKPFARDFQVKNYVTDDFTGDDQTSALNDFHVWHQKWAHAEVKLRETCCEIDDDARLHLLRVVLGGRAAKLTASALTVEAALATLEEKYDDVVALVESYIPLPSEESCDPEEEATQAIAFLDRWPRIEEQLKTHNVSIATFCAIRILLTRFGGNSAVQWKTHVKSVMRERSETTELGEVYNLTAFRNWILKVRDKKLAQATKSEKDEGTSAGLFATQAREESKKLSPVSGCLVCGTRASHKAADCAKVAALSPSEMIELCKKKGWCSRCVDSAWSPAHSKECSQRCDKCPGRHLTVRHHHYPGPSANKRQADSRSQSREPKKAKVEPSREPASSSLNKDDGEKLAAAIDRAVDRRLEAQKTASRGNYRGRGRGRGGKFRGDKKGNTAKKE